MKKNRDSMLWNRHLKFPFKRTHANVTHTYEAKAKSNDDNYSFLPYASDGERVSIPFSGLPEKYSRKIKDKVKGKYPVLLDESEALSLAAIIHGLSRIKIIGDIAETAKPTSGSEKVCRC